MTDMSGFVFVLIVLCPPGLLLATATLSGIALAIDGGALLARLLSSSHAILSWLGTLILVSLLQLSLVIVHLRYSVTGKNDSPFWQGALRHYLFFGGAVYSLHYISRSFPKVQTTLLPRNPLPASFFVSPGMKLARFINRIWARVFLLGLFLATLVAFPLRQNALFELGLRLMGAAFAVGMLTSSLLVVVLLWDAALRWDAQAAQAVAATELFSSKDPGKAIEAYCLAVTTRG